MSCVPEIPREDDFDEKAKTVEITLVSLAAVVSAVRAAVKIFKATGE